jgi:hypothetical protein
MVADGWREEDDDDDDGPSRDPNACSGLSLDSCRVVAITRRMMLHAGNILPEFRGGNECTAATRHQRQRSKNQTVIQTGEAKARSSKEGKASNPDQRLNLRSKASISKRAIDDQVHSAGVGRGRRKAREPKTSTAGGVVVD